MDEFSRQDSWEQLFMDMHDIKTLSPMGRGSAGLAPSSSFSTDLRSEQRSIRRRRSTKRRKKTFCAVSSTAQVSANTQTEHSLISEQFSTRRPVRTTITTDSPNTLSVDYGARYRQNKLRSSGHSVRPRKSSSKHSQSSLANVPGGSFRGTSVDHTNTSAKPKRSTPTTVSSGWSTPGSAGWGAQGLGSNSAHFLLHTGTRIAMDCYVKANAASQESAVESEALAAGSTTALINNNKITMANQMSQESAGDQSVFSAATAVSIPSETTPSTGMVRSPSINVTYFTFEDNDENVSGSAMSVPDTMINNVKSNPTTMSHASGTVYKPMTNIKGGGYRHVTTPGTHPGQAMSRPYRYSCSEEPRKGSLFTKPGLRDMLRQKSADAPDPEKNGPGGKRTASNDLWSLSSQLRRNPLAESYQGVSGIHPNPLIRSPQRGVRDIPHYNYNSADYIANNSSVGNGSNVENSGTAINLSSIMGRNPSRVAVCLTPPKANPDHLSSLSSLASGSIGNCSGSRSKSKDSAGKVGEIVTINVSGTRFQIHRESLSLLPDSLLGNPVRRAPYYRHSADEYFFDHSPACFEPILAFYQAGGTRRLRRPDRVPVEKFLRELHFYDLGVGVMAAFWQGEGYRAPPAGDPLPTNPIQRTVWQLMEHPDSGTCARIVAFLSVFVIVISTATFCLETLLPDAHQNNHTLKSDENNITNNTYKNILLHQNYSNFSNNNNFTVDLNQKPPSQQWEHIFFMIELICIMWFTFEFVARLASCPSKWAFAKSFLNLVDFAAIVPFYINLALKDGGSSAMSLSVLRVLRLVRVFRIFKLSRHSSDLQILGKTFSASVQELGLLVFFLGISLVLFSSALYFAETGVDGSKFYSIPESFWYVIVTMTTVGYGDMTPEGPLGKCVGAVCAVMGVLVLALPVPVIVANFKHFYNQDLRLRHMKTLGGGIESLLVEVSEVDEEEEEEEEDDGNGVELTKR